MTAVPAPAACLLLGSHQDCPSRTEIQLEAGPKLKGNNVTGMSCLFE